MSDLFLLTLNLTWAALTLVFLAAAGRIYLHREQMNQMFFPLQFLFLLIYMRLFPCYLLIEQGYQEKLLLHLFCVRKGFFFVPLFYVLLI